MIRKEDLMRRWRLVGAGLVCVMLGATVGGASAQGDNPEWNALVAFKNHVEYKTEGKIEVKLFPSAQLGAERACAALTPLKKSPAFTGSYSLALEDPTTAPLLARYLKSLWAKAVVLG